MTNDTCEQFLKARCKVMGVSYKQFCKEHVRGPVKNSVYIDDCQFKEDHCVHCARSHVLGLMANEGD